MSAPHAVRVGVVGCGRISPAYLLAPTRFADLDVVACSDVDIARARQRAQQFDIPRACSVAELMADDEIEVVVNLTPPGEHATVSTAAIEAGRSVYAEKPLAIDRPQARAVLDRAATAGVRVGCSPDTFLSPALQTCRALIDQGAIGTPIGAVACYGSRGPELRHPDPGAYYQPGGGPLLDIGPYYLTALVSLLGPVRRVSGATTSGSSERLVFSGPQRGSLIPVTAATHVAATVEFAGGVVASLMTSFDVWATGLPRIEIYGSHGSLSVPDPDGYIGVVRLLQAGSGDWREMLVRGAADRGIGLADMARGLRTARPPRASGALAYHVLDAALTILESADRGLRLDVESSCTRPEPLPEREVLAG